VGITQKFKLDIIYLLNRSMGDIMEFQNVLNLELKVNICGGDNCNQHKKILGNVL